MTLGEAGKASRQATGVGASLTTFVGRAGELDAVTRLLGRNRLVTITGPGGVGKTRLAIEVARRMADQFSDGVCFVDLGAETDAARVPAEVVAALGARPAPGRQPLEVLTEVLATRQLLIVLDNCEHLLTAVAELCGVLLPADDDVRMLATSREQLWVDGEARYRLPPLELPASDELPDIARSAAVRLFAERAGQADPRFSLSAEHAPLAARVVARLDGMPLAIELAAARVEALGLSGLADRIDDAMRLLAGNDRIAADRHKSLAAVASWSYELLAEREQRVFRRLTVFPGPFGLEAAEALAGPEAGPLIQRLVDCSLVVPPQRGPDQRLRYTMLHTLRVYGRGRLADADEEPETMAALAAFALSVAEQALAGLETSSQERAAFQWLDAEDPTLIKALEWLLTHDPERALRLAVALAPWLRARGRLVEAYGWLSSAVQRASPGSQAWTRAHVSLGRLSVTAADTASSIEYYSAAAAAAAGDQGASRELVDALVGRAVIRVNLGDAKKADEDLRQALEAARASGYLGGEAQALTGLGALAHYSGDSANVLSWARQARGFLEADIPGDTARWAHMVLAFVLSGANELDAARQICADGLVRSRDVADLAELVSLLTVMANLECQTGHTAEAGAHLREAAEVASRTGAHLELINCIDQCGQLFATTGRWADAVTLWAALDADRKRTGLPPVPADDSLGRIERDLGPAQLQEARQRGARMTLRAAVELVMMLTATEPPETQPPPRTVELSARERELVVLVAQGQTNAEIAARLVISVRTVGSHLDRIRDKTGCRRRADLTRLALREGLV